ncbi:MAG: family 10 glycosylhydrolase [Calditrichaeota bacterium]|nr:family 10 glycosylhydrolase [Calditrichota bacterium]
MGHRILRGITRKLALLCLLAPLAVRGAELRALWVTRWDYRTAEDVRAIVQNAAQYRFNTLLFQVRGNGTVCYRSSMEPWAEEFGGQDPGWDPLQTAIDEAHARGIALHAWVNVYPGWRGTVPPADPQQLWNSHRDWFMVDPNGAVQRLNNHYTWLSPTNPEVQAYLHRLFVELLERYDVDGIHLDYFRFPGPGFSFDLPSLTQFRLYHNGRSPAEAPAAWDEWRRSALTRLLTVLYGAVKAHRPDAVVSSAVIGDLQTGRQLFLQDSHRWLAMGVIDVIFPMIYTSDTTLFRRLAAEHLQDDKGRLVCPGIDATADWRAQVEIARRLGAQGFALFSYQALFPKHTVTPAAAQDLMAVQPEPALPPDLAWKTSPKDVQGPLIPALFTAPPVVREGEPFKVLCHISDPSGVYDDSTGSEGQGVHLVWSVAGKGGEIRELKMSALPSHEGWYITDQEIPAQRAATELLLRVFARDNADPKRRNLGYSPVTAIVVDFSQPLFSCRGEFGPLVWNATAVAVDSTGQVWVTSLEDRCVHVLAPDGSERDFSPIRVGLAANGEAAPLRSPATVAVDSGGIIHLGCATSPGVIFRFGPDGRALPGVEVPYPVGCISFDRFGRAFVSESGRALWHVYDTNWQEMEGSPFGDGSVANGLAVSPDGTKVYVACESEGTVQVWRTEATGTSLRYQRQGNLAVRGIGKGGVHTDQRGTIFVSHMPAGRVTILDGEGNVVGFLHGGSPPLRAPKNVALCAAGDVLYVLETGAAGPSRLSRWVQKPGSQLGGQEE